MIGFKRHCTSALLVSSLCVWPTGSSTDSYAQNPLSTEPSESLYSASLIPRRPKPDELKEEEDGKEASEEETKQQQRSNRPWTIAWSRFPDGLSTSSGPQTGVWELL